MTILNQEDKEVVSENSFPPREEPSTRRTIWLWVMVVSVFGILIPPAVGIIGTLATVNDTMERARAAELADVDSISRSLSQSLAPTVIGTVISVGFLALFAFSFAGWIVSGRVVRREAQS